MPRRLFYAAPHAELRAATRERAKAHRFVVRALDAKDPRRAAALMRRALEIAEAVGGFFPAEEKQMRESIADWENEK